MDGTLPFTITNQILESVSSVSEKVGELKGLRILEAGAVHLRRNNRLRAVGSTIKMEPDPFLLSPADIRAVVDGYMDPGEERELLKVRNVYAAYEMTDKADPYSIRDLRRVHRILSEGLTGDGGEYRKQDCRVFNGGKYVFEAPPAYMVPELTQNLFAWMRESRENTHPLILSAMFHYGFLFIQPFSAGNGAMARLWQTILLAGWRPVFAFIPVESRMEKARDDYYRAAAECCASGSSDAFIVFCLEQIDKALDDVIRQAKNGNEQTSEYVKRMLAVMEYDVPYPASVIMERLGLKSRETFRKNYMNPAMEQGFVKMTVPDKPNSRNQRYVKG